MTMTRKLLTAEEHEEFIDKFDNFLFDCDGKNYNDQVSYIYIIKICVFIYSF